MNRWPWLFVVAVVGACTLAACASSVPACRFAQSDRESSIAAAESELRRSQFELASLEAGTQIDCSRACMLTANICALAKRICALAADDATTGLAPRCQDATSRCQQAQKATADRCACAR
jgi:hypothetical protein